jgi:2-methylcitrate dehydratase PrpD
MDYLDTLSHFAATLDYRQTTDAQREQLGWVLADTLAAMVAGSAEPELQALAQRQPHADSGNGAVLVGLGKYSHREAAAFVNGTSGTFLEMDEGNRFSRGHPAIHVIPAVLALAGHDASSAETFLSAIVTGYEVGSRLGAASQLRGALHPHGTWGTVGAAAAAARMTGMSPGGMRETISLSASLATATSKQTMLEGGLVRNVYAGMSNRNGLLAIDLVTAGFTGERDGPASLLGKVLSDRFDPASVIDGLGQNWHFMRNYFKLHSCCRYNHGTLDALDHLAATQGLPAVVQIERIEVETYNLAAELIDPAPRNTLAAKFSVPFAVATRLVTGTSTLSSFTWDALRNPQTLALAQKVEVREDPAMSQRLPMERPAKVTLHLRDGRQLVGQAGVNRGDDAAPYTREELTGKFLNLTGRIWPQAQCEALLQATLALARLELPLQDWLGWVAKPPQAA